MLQSGKIKMQNMEKKRRKVPLTSYKLITRNKESIPLPSLEYDSS
jgi:hypothetical protein